MAQEIIRGKVHKFGDNINTDAINPAQYMELTMDDMIAHVLEGADPDFARRVRPGDILVAGRNFGSGSSRETAPVSIKGCGISVVIAEFFARIFYRNAINIGLKALICKQASEIQDGDELEVDPASGRILDLTTGREYWCDPLPPHILELVEDGGLLPHLERRLGIAAKS
ncbi:3-isopropylmalate dehydratase small subunit [uncultured Oscillibacter sp.]|uniref:3-isopropylmalate dehydratase small subunit n=1 Tax=uncultured Oscillibacter sp. TaxID=876091 RepID=UPI0025DE12D8|nr:3-isopropylmalate dehydratase small subunit [uncultured Oscillibacter sp.]